MKDKHTPGPWKMEEYSSYGGYDCMTGGIRVGPVVLDGADYGQKHCSDELPPERMFADARLISAAPDLLEACRCLLSNLEYLEPDGWMSGNVHGDDVAAARAAIKKATNEA